MLIKNGEILDYSSKEGLEHKARIEEIKQRKGFVVFRNPKADSVKYYLSNGKREETPSVCVLHECPIQTENGWETWAYTTQKPVEDTKNGGLLTVRSRRSYVKTDLTLDPKRDFEYIYYLENFCVSVKNGTIEKYVEEEKTKKEVKTITDDIEVKAMIVSKLSPVSVEKTGGESHLRTLASAWGVLNAFDKDINAVKLELLNNVNNSEKRKTSTKRGYAELMEDVFELGSSSLNGNTSVEIFALIQKAIDAGKVKFITDNKMAYVFTPLDKELIRIKASDLDVKMIKLKNHLISHPEDLDLILTELGEEIKVALTIEEVEMETNYRKLQRYCKDLQIDFTKSDGSKITNSTELRSLIIERLENIS